MEPKLTLDFIKRLRVPIRDKAGKLLWMNRFHWYDHSRAQDNSLIHWELKFTIDGWEWGFDLAPSKPNDWDNSEYVMLWLHNYDPNRFLVALHLETEQDLIRFFEAFKVEYDVLVPEDTELPAKMTQTD